MNTPHPTVLSPDRPSCSAAPWLHRAGKALIFLSVIWFSYISFLPPNLFSLVLLLYVLSPLFGVTLLLGIWHLFKTPHERKYAIGVMTVFPLAVLFSILLHKQLPVVTGKTGGLFFSGVLVGGPLWLLSRWLWNLTSASSNNGTNHGVLTKVLLGGVVALLMASLFLVCVLFGGDSVGDLNQWLGRGWYERAVSIVAALATIMAVIGLPYAVLGFVRGTRHRGAMLAIIIGLVLIGLCLGTIVLFIAALMIG